MKRLLSLAAALAASVVLAATPSHAEKIRIAYLRSNTYVPFLQAQKMGYFAKEGLEPEVVMLNNGPAELAALLSDSADVAMVNMVPLISARSQGQPLKAFMTYNMEVYPNVMLNHFVASGRSGVKALTGLKGKTVAINAANGGCDLAARDQLMKAGVAMDGVNVVVMPFPQMQAALELGTVDAACIVDPFFTSMMSSDKVKGIDLAPGGIADMKDVGQYAQDGYVASETWLAKNPKIAAAFVRVIQAATKDLDSDRKLFETYLQTEFQMAPETTAKMMLDLNSEHMVADPKDYQPVITAMVRTGMIKAMSASDLVVSIKP